MERNKEKNMLKMWIPVKDADKILLLAMEFIPLEERNKNGQWNGNGCHLRETKQNKKNKKYKKAAHLWTGEKSNSK